MCIILNVNQLWLIWSQVINPFVDPCKCISSSVFMISHYHQNFDVRQNVFLLSRIQFLLPNYYQVCFHNAVEVWLTWNINLTFTFEAGLEPVTHRWECQCRIHIPLNTATSCKMLVFFGLEFMCDNRVTTLVSICWPLSILSPLKIWKYILESNVTLHNIVLSAFGIYWKGICTA